METNNSKEIAPKDVSINKEGSKEIVTKVIASEPNINKSKAGASTQMQLLHLAKSFALDGGMKVDEKQMPLEDRSNKRERLDKIRKQKNMEVIIEKSLAYCSDNEIASRTDQDWFNSYIKLAEEISNTTMQDLWAKILAGEISQPGSYSLKALQVFRTMSINDAKLLAKACSLAIKDQSRKNIRLISGCYQKPGILNFFDKNRLVNINLSHYGLNYPDLLSLADNHLIYIQESESNLLNKNEVLHFNYNGINLNLAVKKSGSILKFYKFTAIGAELAHLINDDPEAEYFNSLKHQLGHHFLVS